METLKILMMGTPCVVLQEMEQQLRATGYCVETAEDVRAGVLRVKSFLPDAIILDPRLPDAERLEVCRRIRSEVPPGQEPAYLLLPRLLFGAKPSRIDAAASQHLERVQALLDVVPRSAGAKRELRLSIAGLEMDLRRHEAILDGRPLRLTPIEFRLLWTIASDPGSVYDRQQLGDRCRQHQQVRRERTIDVHIKSLRTKLGERAALIQTVHGLGYRLGVSLPEEKLGPVVAS